MTKQEELNNELIKSSSDGHLEVVKSLIDKGADVNVKDSGDWTALIWSSAYEHLDIVKYLIGKGADVNAKDNGGYTALMESSSNGHLEVVKYLIEQGADVNAENKYGWTALMKSSYKGHLEVFKYLIPHVYDYNQFEDIYNDLKIEQKHILFKHFMNNRELLEQVNPRKMKGFIKDINEYKDGLK